MCIYSEEDRVGEAELVRQVLRFCLTEHTDGDAVLLQLAQALLGLLDGQALCSFRICIHDYIHTRIHIYSILRLDRCEKLCQANIARANCLLARSLACSISLSRARALSLHGTYRVSKGKIKDEVSAIRKWSIKATLRSTYPVPKHKG